MRSCLGQASSHPVNEGGTLVQSFEEPLQAVDVDRRAVDDDSSSDDGSNDESADAPIDVDLNRVPIMLGQERTQFEQMVEPENVHRQLTDEEIIAAETVALNPDSIQYMEALVPEFENASTWVVLQ